MHTFVDALDKLMIEVCDTCNESSFDMNIRQVCGRDICKCCFAESKKKNFTIHRFSSDNDMDQEDDASSILNDEVVGDRERLPDEEWQNAARLEHLQERLRHLRYLFIDEKSMIGANTLSRIHNRLSVAFPAYADIPFGGRSVILISDFAQLPPIGEIPMYATAPKFPKVQTLQGITLYAQFDRFVRLRTNMWQGSYDQAVFRDILLRARNGDWLEDDWQELFNYRALCNLPRSVRDEFIHATYLFPTNEAVNTFNRDNLERLGRPVAKIDARNTGQLARSVLEAVSSDVACGLPQLLQLSIGARIMLRKNLWTDMGLVNGALGM